MTTNYWDYTGEYIPLKPKPTVDPKKEYIILCIKNTLKKHQYVFSTNIQQTLNAMNCDDLYQLFMKHQFQMPEVMDDETQKMYTRMEKDNAKKLYNALKLQNIRARNATTIAPLSKTNQQQMMINQMQTTQQRTWYK